MEMANIDENDVLDAEALNDLYHWIDAVPLSRPKKNIARDFSDGVSVAEIIHHYLPRSVDLHNYVVVSSTGQKRINWNTLNRKVFTKMGIKLSDLTLTQLVEAKPGAIEQVLWDLRRKIRENSTASKTTIDTKHELPNTKSTTGGHAKMTSAPSSHMVKTIVAPKGSSLTMRSSHVQITSRKSALCTNSLSSSTPQPRPAANMNMGKACGHTNNNKAAKSPSSTKPLPASTERETALEKPTTAEDNVLSSTVSQKMSFGDLGEVPSQIVFRGHKMVAVEMLENKDKEIKDLENSKKQLSIKIDRLQKLVHIKDTRIEDLSHQLSNLRTMYESVTGNATSSSVEREKTEDVNNNEA